MVVVQQETRGEVWEPVLMCSTCATPDATKTLQ